MIQQYKEKGKRIFVSLLAALIVAGLIPSAVFADEMKPEMEEKPSYTAESLTEPVKEVRQLKVTVSWPANYRPEYGDAELQYILKVEGVAKEDEGKVSVTPVFNYTSKSEPNTACYATRAEVSAEGTRYHYQIGVLWTASYAIVAKRLVVLYVEDVTLAWGDVLPETPAVRVENLVNGETLDGCLSYSCSQPTDKIGTRSGALRVVWRGNAAHPHFNFRFSGTTKVSRLGDLTIAKRPVAITVDDAGKVYGDADPVFTGSVRGTIPAGGDIGTITFYRTNPSENAGVYSGVLTARFSGVNKNYDVQVVPGDYRISPREVTLAAKSYTINEGEADPEWEAVRTEGSLAEGDTLDYTVVRTSGAVPGRYDINILWGSNPNYRIKTLPGTLWIRSVAAEPDDENPIHEKPADQEQAEEAVDENPAKKPAEEKPVGEPENPAPAPSEPESPELPETPVTEEMPAAEETPGAEITENPAASETSLPSVPVVAPVPAVVQQIAEPAIPDAGIAGALEIQIEEPAVPKSAEPETVEIQERGTPLAAAPVQSSGWALLNLLLAAATVIMAGALYGGYFRRKDVREVRLRKFTEILSAAAALISVLLFFLTEDFSGKMIVTDQWTVWMAAIAAAEIATLTLSGERPSGNGSANPRPMNS